MKVLAYTALHYGMEYLEQTIKSIDDHVDKIVCLYTEKPSYGFNSVIKCPESEKDLRDLAHASSNKIQWVKIRAKNEGQHRNMAFNYSAGYDIMLTLDSDEIMERDSLADLIKRASQTDSRYIGIDGFVNFWRSFDYIVVDWFHPVRIHNLRSKNRQQKDIKGTVYHMGYAQSEAIMRYKFQVHGHKNEIMSNYLDKKYYAWTQIDCGVNWLHPASTTIWQDAEKYDKSQLPDLLKSHPNFNKEFI